jgi:hypothetical protein
MSENFHNEQNLDTQYENLIERSENRRKQLEELYKKKTVVHGIIIVLYVVFLFILCFGQFLLLDYSFEQRLNLYDSDQVFGIPLKHLLSLLVTAALPITTLLDESGFLGRRLKISFLGIRFSPIIWIVLPGDMLLTLQAVLSANQNAKKIDVFAPGMAFLVAAIFATFAFYLSQGIVAAITKYVSASKNLQIIKIYHINPTPLYQDAEQIKLMEENEAVRKEAELAREKLAEENILHKNELETKTQEYEEQLQSKDALYNQQLEEKENQVQKYREKLEEVDTLKSNFNKIKKPIIDLVGKMKDFAGLDESMKDFKFPSLEISKNDNTKTVEKPIYYFAWQNQDNSWEDLLIPSELTPVGYSFLNAIQQQKVLPPPHIGKYAPKNDLPKCLVLRFDYYGVIVYCRDEEYVKNAVKWDIQDELEFKSKLSEQQNKGYQTLEFTSQQIMSNQILVIEQIKNAIDSKIESDYN